MEKTEQYLDRIRGSLIGGVAGRAFVRIYYALTPTLVRYLGHTKLFQCFWRGRLDRLVKRLYDGGVEETRYEDQ